MSIRTCMKESRCLVIYTVTFYTPSTTEILLGESTSHYRGWTCWVLLFQSLRQWVPGNVTQFLPTELSKSVGGLWGSFLSLLEGNTWGEFASFGCGKWYVVYKSGTATLVPWSNWEKSPRAKDGRAKIVMQSPWTHQLWNPSYLDFPFKERLMFLLPHCWWDVVSSSWNTLPDRVTNMLEATVSQRRGDGMDISLIHLFAHT